MIGEIVGWGAVGYFGAMTVTGEVLTSVVDPIRDWIGKQNQRLVERWVALSEFRDHHRWKMRGLVAGIDLTNKAVYLLGCRICLPIWVVWVSRLAFTSDHAWPWEWFIQSMGAAGVAAFAYELLPKACPDGEGE